MMLLYVTLVILTPVNGYIVRTSTGLVRGKIEEYKGFKYYTFLGIPYAESPAGERRFLAPIPKKPWKGVLNATKEGPVCPQVEDKYRKEQMSEDCLYLNIYVPALSKKKIPVLVFVHGGGFKALSGNSDVMYGPQLLLEKGVIFVSLNYRIGALGFLSLDVEEAPGNAGIKDVLLASKWVHQNIGRFSGDKSRITIGGHSSGSGIANFLLLTEKSIGLFQQAIFISGSVLSYRFINPENVDMALTLAEKLGIQSKDPRDVALKLKKVDAYKIVAEQERFKTDRNHVELLNQFSPTIEIDTTDAIITKSPYEIIENGIPNKVPVIVGLNANEGIFVLRRNLGQVLKDMQVNLELLIPYGIGYPYGSTESKALLKSIAEFYFKDMHLSSFTFESAINYLSDIIYNYAAHEWVRLSRIKNDKKIFSYLFEFDGDLNWAKLNYGLKQSGTCHSDEIGYMFLTNVTKQNFENMNKENRKLVKLMTTVITNFVKFGDPSPSYMGVKWPDSGDEGHHLWLSQKPEARSSPPFAARMQFWSDVYRKYKIYLSNGGAKQRKLYH